MRRPEFPHGVSLRVRLLTGLVTLLALGLTVTGVVSALLLRSYLFSRTDQRLAQAQELVDSRLVSLLPRTAPDLGTALLSRAVAPTDYIVEIKPPTGSTTVVSGRSGDRSGSAPLSDGVDDLATRAAAGTPFTIHEGQARYRALAGRLPAGGGTDLVAVPLHSVEATIGRLVAIESLAGVAVLALAGGSAWFMLGRGLRPLRDVAETASAIAAGDLSRRVPRSPTRGETGRLAVALNVMLGQIQAAFDERVRSRERLRLFVADASHELRTPLTSVRGYVDLLRKGMVPPGGVDDALRRVQEETARMGALVDDMLMLAHFDEQPRLELTEIDLTTIVGDVAADATAVEPDRRITVDCPPRCVMIGDEDALRQIVGNLLANVRTHTPTSATVTVTVRGAGDHVAVRVSDTGPGMSSEAVDRIFDRFYRASDSRDRVHGGSGLGMSIVAAAAAAHGGTASVWSAPGRGTTVTVTLPLDPAAL